MTGFSNIRAIVDADEAGQTFVGQFRKVVSSAATITASWVDYSYFAGLPLANFYASTPLESAYLDPSRGIYVPDVNGSQYLKSLMLMTGAASATTTTSRLQQAVLCDYLMYYPFIDTDAVGELQEMVQAVSLPRYTSGQVILIAQAASSTIGQFTMTYTNQDGVAGRVSPNVFTQIVSGGGQSLLANISGGGFNPYMPLQAGDSGVQSIESVTFTAAGGGLMAMVIVKPLQTQMMFEECRRTTSSTLDSFGSASQVIRPIHQAGLPEIKDGAALNIFAKCNGGSIASSQLAGIIETVWN